MEIMIVFAIKESVVDEEIYKMVLSNCMANWKLLRRKCVSYN